MENNGKNLYELNISMDYNIKNSFVQFCPNLQKLFINLEEDELYILKSIFNGCQSLESITIWYDFLEELNGKSFWTILKDSPKNFHELKIDVQLKFFPNDLESFFF